VQQKLEEAVFAAAIAPVKTYGFGHLALHPSTRPQPTGYEEKPMKSRVYVVSKL